MIDAKKLEEMDTDVSGTIEMKDYRESLKRMRDVVKKEIRGVEFVIMGIEDQMHIHYAIPLRNMIYDALGYLKEYREISARNRKTGVILKNPEEFLSGLRREDRLHPIVTLVIYYGDKPWDGPMSLKDMLSDMPKTLEEAVSDYKIHLLQIADSGKYEFSSEDVRAAFEISREAMNDRLDEIAEKYHDTKLSPEVTAFVGAVIGSQDLMEIGSKKEDGTMSIAAVEKWEAKQREIGRQAGIQEGRQAGIQEGRQAGIQEGRQAGIQEGRQAGIQEGRQAGIREGIQEGWQAGIQEGRQMIILNMLRDDMPMEVIVRLTGVSEEKIDAIRKEMDDTFEK